MRIVARRVQYSFLELGRYRTVLRDHIFGIDGVISLDLHESSNRVKIGTAGPGAQEEVRTLLTALGIPHEAVMFWTLPYPRKSVTLDDRHPQGNVEGGWRIVNGRGGNCTLGLPHAGAQTPVPYSSLIHIAP